MPNETVERPITVHNTFANIDGLIVSSREQCASDCSALDPSGALSPADVGQAATVADVVLSLIHISSPRDVEESRMPSSA